MNQKHPGAAWGQSGALGYGQALGRLLAVLAAVGSIPHPAPMQGGLPQGLGTQGRAQLVHGESTQGRKKCPEPVSQPCCPVAATTFNASKKTSQGWERRARSWPVPARMVGGDPCMESLPECPSRGALCACRWVAWPWAMSSGLPGALQGDEVPPAASLSLQAGAPRPGST